MNQSHIKKEKAGSYWHRIKVTNSSTETERGFPFVQQWLMLCIFPATIGHIVLEEGRSTRMDMRNDF